MKKKCVLAECDGVLYVETYYSGIHPLIILTDGFRITFFGKKKNTYIKVDDAIAWHEKEMLHAHDKTHYETCVKILREAKKATIIIKE